MLLYEVFAATFVWIIAREYQYIVNMLYQLRKKLLT